MKKSQTYPIIIKKFEKKRNLFPILFYILSVENIKARNSTKIKLIRRIIDLQKKEN